MSVLIVYSTVDGHTLHICERLQSVVKSRGHEVTLADLDLTPVIDLQPYDCIVIGASIRYGRHRPQVMQFIHKHLSVLHHKPSAFFSVNIVARKPHKNRPETNPYVRKFFRQIDWKPKIVDVFAGKLDYPRYGFLDRQMIRLIMLITQGPTDPSAVVDFTDWNRVDALAQRVCALAVPV